MDRFISKDFNTNLITSNFLSSDAWDIIELKIRFDIDKFKEWHTNIFNNYHELFFNLRDEKYIREEYKRENLDKTLTTDNLDISNYSTGKEIMDYSYSKGEEDEMLVCQLSWLSDRDIPIAPTWCLDPKYYPEINDNNLDHHLQEKFKFGYFKNVYDHLGEEGLWKSCIRYHDKNTVLSIHTDGPFPSIRMHIPIISHANSFFLFGDNLERSYNLKEGSAYLVNSGVPHGTTNTNQIRSHIQTKPSINYIINQLIEKDYLIE